MIFLFLSLGCITDIRFNGKSFPVNADSSSDSDVKFVRRQNVADGCTSDGCLNVNCPGLQVCFDLWRDFDCRSVVMFYVTFSYVYVVYIM